MKYLCLVYGDDPTGRYVPTKGSDSCCGSGKEHA